MNKLIPFLCKVCGVLLLTIITGCSSTGNSGSSSYHHRSTSWDYDTDYRSGVNDYYDRPAARAHARSEVGGRSGGGRGGGGGGGRR